MIPLWLINGENDLLAGSIGSPISLDLEFGKVGGVIKSLPAILGERGTVVDIDLFIRGELGVQGYAK